MSGWLHSILRAYRILLAFYPSGFRADFGDEMQDVFADILAGAKAYSWWHVISSFARELRDFPGSLLEAHAADRLLGGDISMNEETISPSTRWQAFLGMLPFLLFGMASMIGKVAHVSSPWGHYPELVVYALALVGLLIGWIRGFPLWSYSYLGWSLVLAWSNTNVWFNGVSNGYRIWIPFGATVLIALLWTRSLQPIRKVLRDIWKDWSRLSLTMYALPAWVGLIYDECHHPQLLAFMLTSTLATAGAAWFFLRSSNLRGRTLAILAGFIMMLITGGICDATWDWHAFHGIPKEPTTWYREVWQYAMLLFFWALFLFWPAIAELIRREAIRQSR